MTHQSVCDYLSAIRHRYERATRTSKSKMLDEAVMVTGYHRKAIIRLLRPTDALKPSQRRGRGKVYGADLVDPLRKLWDATGRVCAQRLHPFLPELVPILQRHGELHLAADLQAALLSMSPSTIERLLRPIRHRNGQRPMSTTKPGTLLRQAIPIRTFADWDDRQPGFLEVDLVAHCADTVEGFYLTTLTAVDIATGWVERQGVFGKNQERVGAALHEIGQRLPFPWLGLDSDNGSEFINHDLLAYCQKHEITFTRSRPYKKNDSAHVEEKNWTAVRRVVGYDRYSTRPALDALNQLYGLLRLHTNFFQPVMQLQRKTRNGAKVHKVYDVPKTPYRRLLEAGVASESQQAKLASAYAGLNPVWLCQKIAAAQNKLWKLADHSYTDSPVSETSRVT